MIILDIETTGLINDCGICEISAMNLSEVLKFCGMKDERKEHNALEDCKLEGEALYRMEFGKNLFPEYSRFKIPDCLKNIK